MWNAIEELYCGKLWAYFVFLVFVFYTTLDQSLVCELPSKEGGEGEEQQAQVSGGEFGERSAKIREESGGGSENSQREQGRENCLGFLLDGRTKNTATKPPLTPQRT